jgi:hypothetical protein
MSKTIATWLALVLALSSAAVFACPGDKSGDGKADISKPAPPKPTT